MVDEALIDEYKSQLASLVGITSKKFDSILRKEFKEITSSPEEIVKRYNQVVVKIFREKGDW